MSYSSAASAELRRSRRPGAVRRSPHHATHALKVALLTGGKDPHYARGLARELASRGIRVALVGSRDEMLGRDEPQRRNVALHDFVGSQPEHSSLLGKVARVLMYYARLLVFAASSDTRLFHILWFRRFPRVERLLLVAYLKLLRKKVVFTAHNVDDRARDGGTPGVADRVSLRFLYRSADHLFVHTSAMRDELGRTFGVPASRVSVVPLGLNDVIPVSHATRVEARRRLGLNLDARVVLFFGNIAPYKGLEDAVHALSLAGREDDRLRLIIAGRVKDAKSYWQEIERLIGELGVDKRILKEVRHIPDEEVGLFFKAADVSILPYRRIYQSGVLGLSYAHGVPVIAANVGSMKDEIVEGETGFLFAPGSVADLATKIQTYFVSSLYEELEARRGRITTHGAHRFSWTANAEQTLAAYRALLQ